jgi:hypothetical protein
MKKLDVVSVSCSDGITPFYSPNLFSWFLELMKDVLPLENKAWCTALVLFIFFLVFLSRNVLFLVRA